MNDPPWLKAAIASGQAVIGKPVNLAALASAFNPSAECRELWTESEFTAQFIHQAHYFGWAAVHWRQSWTKDGRPMTAVQGDGVGYPDVQCVRGDFQIYTELKVKRNTASSEQLAWLERLARLPHTITAVWFPRDWPALTEAMENPHAYLSKMQSADRLGEDEEQHKHAGRRRGRRGR